MGGKRPSISGTDLNVTKTDASNPCPRLANQQAGARKLRRRLDNPIGERQADGVAEGVEGRGDCGPQEQEMVGVDEDFVGRQPRRDSSEQTQRSAGGGVKG